MKFVTGLVCLGLLYFVPAEALQLTDAEKKHCQDNGGCVFSDRKELDKLLEEAYRAGMKSQKTHCFRNI